MNRTATVLHVLPHAGGGVGAVLRALLAADSAVESRFRHVIASLEYLNEVTVQHCNRHMISWIDKAMTERRDDLRHLIESADIVLMHWWNHPLMTRLLFDGLPESRLVVWSHVNGYFAPQIFLPELFDMSDRFIFSSRTSLQSPVVRSLTDENKAKLRVIRSCSGIPAGAENICLKQQPFEFGYVGTVEPVKMHSDFLIMCAGANIPTPCIVAGGPAHEELRARAERMDLGGRFQILGPVKDPEPIYRRLHAFAYPLNPRHYGTGEQVLIEAMAFGAVPVVLANPPEEAIISHGETGLIAKDAVEFSTCLRRLMDCPEERSRLAEGGRTLVFETCRIEDSVRLFHDLFEEVLVLQRMPHQLQLSPIEGVPFGTPLHLFLSLLGDTDEREIFEDAVRHSTVPAVSDDFFSKTRGTPFHYLNMLERDRGLEALCHAVSAG